MGDNETSTCGYNVYFGYAGVCISACVICDSILTIFTISRSHQLHTNQYIFISSLAVADIMLSLSFVLTAVIRLTWINSIVDRRNIVNNLAYGTMFSCIVLTGLHMSIIAIDRYIRIAHPFYYIQSMTKQRTVTILSFTYLFSFVNACIPAIVYQDSKYSYCISIHQPFEYFYANIVTLVININVVFVCYFNITRISINHKKAAISRHLQAGHIGGAVINRSGGAAVMKSVRFFIAMFGVYFLLCLPPLIMDCVGFYYYVPNFLIVIGAHCFPLHSLLNFVICFSLNHGFRKALKQVFADFKKVCFRRCNGYSM